MRAGLGVDVGITACGISVLSHDGNIWRFVGGSTVYTPSKKELVLRLKMISDGLRNTFRAKLSWIAVEDPTHVITYKQRKGETNFDALRQLIVVGIACEYGFSLGIPVMLVEPSDVKHAVGASSTAEKDQVIRAVHLVVRDCPTDMTEHMADGAAAAIAGERMLHFKNTLQAAHAKR